MKPNSFYIFLLFFLSAFSLNAQKWEDNHWGLQVGISADIGTHINFVGLKVQGYYTYEFVQFNLGNHIRFNSTHFGQRKNHVTQRINTGIALLAGERNSTSQLILDGLHHQSEHNYALAYNYLWYFDNAGTSQRSGGFAFHVQQLSFYIENDFFSGTGRDRFRTNYIGISYHDDLYNISLNSQLWTGETRQTRLMNTTDSLYFYGYKDLSATHYGKTSHGTITLGVDYQIFYGNHVALVAGIDSEHIRDVLQNKLMHNKVFLPTKWRKYNANYPMLNIAGFPIHYKEEAAPTRPFLQIGLNRSYSY